MNIAKAQKEIEVLSKQIEELYRTMINPLSDKVVQYKQLIKDNCQHHEDFLLVEETYETDEYGTHCLSWDTVIVTCSICGKYATVNLNKFKKSEYGYRDLMLLSREEIEELK